MTISRRSVLAAAAALAATGLPVMAQPLTKSRALSTPKASPQAKALYKFLCDTWGKHTLTGQQESGNWHGSPRYELDYIQQVSGKQPAILGLDYIDPKDRSGVNDRATAWYRNGGIVTLCWHWGNPLVGPGYNESKIHFDGAAALKDGTPENIALLRDMDEIAGYLTTLRDAKVPVLWRPFHEFTGDWFWWGQCGPDVFKALWRLMYDRFTHQKGLNNLIWVLGYTKDPQLTWFPGDDCVDIVGADYYVEDHGPQKEMYDAVKTVTGNSMPITMHECGPIPDPELLKSSGAAWLWFLTWHSEFIRDGKANPADWIKTVYNSDWYLTLEELPNLQTYGHFA